jgi:hypothetical protein
MVCGSSEPELLLSLRLTGLNGRSLQLSVPGELGGLANNLRKPVGEAVEAFAGRTFWRVLNTTTLQLELQLFANDPPEARL